jgi:hypothetical protein
MKIITLIILSVFFVPLLNAQGRDNSFLDNSFFVSIIGNPQLYGIECGGFSQNHGFQNCAGITFRKSTKKGYTSLLCRLQIGSFLNASERNFIILGTEFGMMPGFELSIGLRSDVAFTLGNGLLVGISAELMWVKETDPFLASAYIGWRF